MRNLRILGLVAVLTIISLFPGLIPHSMQPQATKSVKAEDSCDWPSFGRNPDGNRVTPDGCGPKSKWPGKLWDFRTDNIIETSQVVYENHVFVGSNDYLYCLDLDSGKEIWKFSTPLGSWTPTIWDNKVYFGAHKSIMSVDIHTGTKVWEFVTDNYIQSVPTIDDGLLYVGSEDHHLYCLDATSGEMVWKYKADSSITSNPILINGLLIFHSSNSLHCMDKKSCDIKWRKRMSAGLFNTVVYYNQKIITGCQEGYLYCINIEDGKTTWQLNVEKSIFDSATVWNDNVYFGRQDGMFYCVSIKNGEIIWCYKAGSGTTAPAVCDNKVYFGSIDKNLYCLDATDGSFLWAFHTDHAIWSAPAISNNKIVFGSFDHMVYCIGDISDLPERGKPDKIEIFAGYQTISIYSTRQIQAHVLNKYNELLPGYTFEWTVEPEFGSITENGIFIPKEPGNATIICKSGKLKATLDVLITDETNKDYLFLELAPGEKLTKSLHIFNDRYEEVKINLSASLDGIITINPATVKIDPFKGANVDVVCFYEGIAPYKNYAFTILMEYSNNNGSTKFIKTVQGFISFD